LSEPLIVRCIVLRVSQVCSFVGSAHRQVYCTTCFSGVFFCRSNSSSGVLFCVCLGCVFLSLPLIVRCIVLRVFQVCSVVGATAYGCSELGVMECCAHPISSHATCIILTMYRSVRGTHTRWAWTSNWPCVEFLRLFRAAGSADNSLMLLHLLCQKSSFTGG